MKAKIRTIDVNCKEWFDRVNGNSYFAGVVIINYDMPTEKRFNMPFQYGYGSQYEYEAFKTLQKAGLIPKDANACPSRYYREVLRAIYRADIIQNCKQKELKEYN
jgi:hypothetical protein